MKAHSEAGPHVAARSSHRSPFAALVVVLATALLPAAAGAAGAPAGIRGFDIPAAAQGRDAWQVGLDVADLALDRAVQVDWPSDLKMSGHLAGQRRNVDTARSLATLNSNGDDPFGRAIAVAQAGTTWQLGTLSASQIESRPTPTSGTPSAALARLALDHGARLNRDAPGLARLDGLARAARDAFVRWIEAFRTLSAASERLAQGPPEVRPNVLGPVLVARSDFLDATVALRDALGSNGANSSEEVVVDEPGLVLVDLREESASTHVSNYFLLIDKGGDDTYRNNAGGSTLGAAAALDLGGDDTYDNPGEAGVNGGGSLASGLLVDAGGNDVYRGGAHSNGGGSVGTGALVDGGGNDVYEGSSNGVNGGADVGAGLLVDIAGDDSYSATHRGTNGGAVTGGPGFLFDGDGRDRYTATDSGTNGAGAIADGFLLDLGAGSDTYQGTDTTNGGALAGTGFLGDAAGDDEYIASGSRANGGSGLGVGLLVDAAGDDVHRADGGSATNGGGVLGQGILVDVSGADEYVASGGSGNGGGNLGVGWLSDLSGDDSYIAGAGGVNGGGNLGGGLLLDQQGRDTYEDGEGGTGLDRTVVPKGTAGAQIDQAGVALPALPLLPAIPPLPPVPRIPQPPQSPPSRPALLEPVADASLPFGQPEEFIGRAADPDSEPYALVVTVRDRATSFVVRVVESPPTLSGFDASAQLTSDLPPGLYTWSAHARDLRGAVGEQSPSRNLTVTS